jgi:hypothetical protein
MDKHHHDSAAAPRYETRDTQPSGVYKFLVVMAVALIASGLICWAMFRFFTANVVDNPASDSPFAETRQLPLGPQLQVNPREDWLKFRQQQEQSLQTYAWENRTAGMARVPIAVAMDLLVKKGVPVQPGAQEVPAETAKPVTEGNAKP